MGPRPPRARAAVLGGVQVQRRRTAAIAGAAAITAFAATLGIGANVGLIGLAQTDHGAGGVDHPQAKAVVTAPPPRQPAPDD